MHRGSQTDHQELCAIVDPPDIFSPCHLTGVGSEVRTGDVMMDADFSAPYARKEAFGEIRAGVSVAVCFFVVDALDVEAGVVERIPGSRLIGMDDRAWLDTVCKKVDCVGFLTNNHGHGAAVALASRDHDATFASLVLSETTIDAVLFPIGRLDVSAEVRAVDFDFARSFMGGGGIGDGFAQLVTQDESCFVLRVEDARQL